MWLTRIFVKRPTLAFVLVVLTLLAGFQSLRSLVVQEQPNTGLPAVNINLQYTGASTSELRDEIVRPIEDALAGSPNLDHMDTTVQTGSASITASFSLESSNSENLTNVQRALQTAQRQLPSDLTAPTVRTADPNQPVVVSLALTSKKYSREALASLALNQIVPVLEQVDGVSNVIVQGQAQPAYNVTVDPALLAASNLTLSDVIAAIEPNNVRAPGGIVYQPDHETQVDIRGDITTPQSVADLPIHVTYSGTSGSGGFGSGGGGGSAAAGGASTGGSTSAGSPGSAGGSSAGGASGGGASGGGTTGGASDASGGGAAAASGGSAGTSSGAGGGTSGGSGAAGASGSGQASGGGSGSTSATGASGANGGTGTARGRIRIPATGATTPPLSVQSNVPSATTANVGGLATGPTTPPGGFSSSGSASSSLSGSSASTASSGVSSASSAAGSAAGGTGSTSGGSATGGASGAGGASGTTGAGATGTGSTGGGTTSSTAGGTGTGATGSGTSGTSGSGSGSTGSGSSGSSGTVGSLSSSATGSGSTSSGQGGSTNLTQSVGGIVQSSSASARPPVDQPVTVTAPSSYAQNLSTAQGTLPNVSSGSLSGGSGTSFSPFVGSLGTWAVPSADKRISDVASVSAGSVPIRVDAHENGQDGVGLAVQKATTASEVTVADSVLKYVPKLKQRFPDIDFTVEHVQATYTRQQLDGVERTLLEGIALTALVMLFFLRSWRNAIVVMIAIPTSLGVTLGAMKMLHLTLDTISLLAMTLVIGILIDDSTVVLENATRHREDGEEPADAAVNGRSEIGLAAIVITLVDVVVFLPIAFIGGPVGKQLSEFGIVVSIATLTSLFVSFTITPAMAGLWSMRSEWKPWPIIEGFNHQFDRLRSSYTDRWLPGAMKRPWPIVIVSVVLCVLAIALVPLGIVGEEYIPNGDQGEIFLQVFFPNGTPLSKTQSTMFAIERHVKSMFGKDLMAEETVAGAYNAPFGGFAQEGNSGQIHIFLTDDHKKKSDDYVDQLRPLAQRIAHGAQVVAKSASAQGGGPRQPIDLLVSDASGADPGKYATAIARVMQQTPGATGVTDSGENVTPQVEVLFDRAQAQSLDVSIGTAATAIRAAMGGAQASQIETATNGLTQIEVIYPLANQTSFNDILDLPVRTQSGGIVRIGDFARLKSSPASLLITRENRNDVVHVSANVAPGYQLSNVVRDFEKRLKGAHIPKSVTYRPAAQGQQDLMGRTLQTLGGSLLASILLVFLMIVALYNSYRTPFVTLFAIPLATIGAFGALALTHNTLNLYSLIGIVLLAGLVTKNGILLVDFADTVRARDKKEKDEAMRDAAATRFRPIIMTTIAMVAGMTPLALGLDPGGSQRASLGVAVIGGLLSSLVLTLVIVPIMYHWLAPNTLKEETKLQSDNEGQDGGRRKPEQPQGGGPAPQPA